MNPELLKIMVRERQRDLQTEAKRARLVRRTKKER